MAAQDLGRKNSATDTSLSSFYRGYFNMINIRVIHSTNKLLTSLNEISSHWLPPNSFTYLGVNLNPIHGGNSTLCFITDKQLILVQNTIANHRRSQRSAEKTKPLQTTSSLITSYSYLTGIWIGQISGQKWEFRFSLDEFIILNAKLIRLYRSMPFP